MKQLLESLPTVEHTVVLGYLDPDPSLDGLGDALGWEELRRLGEGAALTFEHVPFDHPLWVLYSSGTTGLPKAIVHGHGGILVEMLKKMHLHVDLHADDRLFWFTTTGWMMWNFVVSALTSEASVVLYDGNPGTPDLNVLWDLAAEAGITCFGTSAAFIANCQKAGIRASEGRDLSRLRSVGSTGSPLSPEGFAWVYESIHEDIWLFSTSGGTDVGTAFVGGVPTLPVYQGELQARSLGVKLESWSPEGKPLIGEVGELVITEPMPSMPIYFWGDPDGSRYRESYFEMFPGIWRHGDWIEITDRGTAIISGRSDATINRGGVRMGTSEIYRAVLTLDEVVDALVLDLPLPGTEGFMPLFVVLRDGATLDDDLSARIRKRIREDCSPRHVPDLIEQIAEVPRTLSGKVLELPVKRILLGAAPDTTVSRDALATPAALDPFEEMARRPPYCRPKLVSANIVGYPEPKGRNDEGTDPRRGKQEVVDARGGVVRAVHDHARQHRRERGAARDPARPRHRRRRARMGRDRLRAQLRRPDAHRRQARRHARTPPHLPLRPRRLHALLAALRARRERRAADRRPRAPGRRRGLHDARHPLDHHRNVPAQGARRGARHLGRRLGDGARDRPARSAA